MTTADQTVDAAPLIAVIAFLALLATFAWTLFDFRSDVELWARRDLGLRAQLAADALRAPLATQNIRRIGEIGQDLKNRHDLLLTVYSPQGGVFYRVAARAESDVSEAVMSGEYRIELGRSKKSVFLPFYEALVGFALAALVGIVGMFVVFFALYRQRVRIREMAKVEKFRSDFIADVSHEIKTPLTGILGAVEMLGESEKAIGEGEEGGGGDGVRAKLLAMITKESKRLQALVQEILDLARLEREGEKLKRVETDLAALVADVAQRYGVVARADAAPRLQTVFASCDPQLVEQALSNLVENAKRHSGSTDITLTLAAPDPSGLVRLTVEDRGIGIPAEHIPRIFERFHRVDPARAAESGGAGLGLSIVRRIARLHGGDVTCENVLPHGARFTLTLPCAITRGTCACNSRHSTR